MEFDFWWLPGAALFFALGWLAARKEASKTDQDQDKRLPDAYVRGLQSLLGEDQLRAIDAFTELARKEPESLDLNLALGHLFRRKGETDRAIRVHQNLLTRSDLTAELRAQLQHELALDFIKAGLFDRAEQALQALAGSSLEAEAQRLRLDLAQRVRDWPLALLLSEALSHTNNDPSGMVNQKTHRNLQAHLHAEIAHQLRGQAKFAEAFQALQKAQALAPDHPRAYIDECLLLIAQTDVERADDTAFSILHRWPEHAARIASAWLTLSDQRSAYDMQAKRFEALAKANRLCPAYDVLQVIVEHLDKVRGAQASRDFLSAEPNESKSLLTLLLRLQIRDAETPSAEALLAALTKRLEALAKQSSRYVCRHCGFHANRHYWQCPGCHQWDSYPAQRADEVASTA